LWSWWPWAAWAVVAIGLGSWKWAVVAGLLAFAAFISSPVEAPPRYGLNHTFGIDSPDFIETMAGSTGVRLIPGNRLDLLNNGDRFYPAMLEAIARSTASITIEAYIYWAGDIGLKFAYALAKRAREGITVKILLDAVGSSSLSNEILKILADGGCQVAWYNPVRPESLDRVNRRTHRKSLIVDGQIAFTGGAGIADQWLGDAQDADHWRDLQVRLEGPAVAPLQTGFAQNWLECTRELVIGPTFFPAPKAAGELAVQTIMSSPETGASTARIMYCLAIISAKRRIFIANPYFIPDHLAIDMLVEARGRGVDVRVMVSGKRNDNVLARRNCVWLYGPLLEAGVVILEYNRTMLHQKTMVVDGLWSTVGTTNFDSRSFVHNEETNVCCCDATVARELEAIFEADSKACRVVTLVEWRSRSFVSKSLDALSTFMRDQV
jgi:cardiolipin synthase